MLKRTISKIQLNDFFVKLILTMMLPLIQFPELFSQSNLDKSEQINQIKNKLENIPSDTARIRLLKMWDELIYEADELEDFELNEQIRLICEKRLKEKLKKDEKKYIQSELASSLNILGNHRRNIGEYASAIELYSRSAALYRELNDVEGISIAENNIGLIYDDLGEYDNALNYFRKCKTIEEKSNRKKELGNSYNNIGLVHFRLKNTDSALIYYKKALKLQTEIKDEKELSITLNNLAIYYSSLKNYDSALAIHQRALFLKKKNNDKSGIAYSLVNLGELHFEMGKFKEAHRLTEEGYQLSIEIKRNENAMRAAFLLEKIYRSENNYKKAWEMLSKYQELKEFLESEENQKAVLRQEFKYKYEQKSFEDSIQMQQYKKLQNEKIARQKAEAEKKDLELKNKRSQQIVLVAGIVLLFTFLVIVYNRFRIIRSQKIIIEQKELESNKQKEIIQEKQNEILASINYAKRIQTSFLATEKELKNNLSDYFVVYKPKDIVSGDFYWCEKIENRIYFAICDCTGHGIPGAFMSLLNISLLNEAVHSKQLKRPDEIFNFVRQILILGLNKNDGQSGNDGMDGIIFCFDENHPEKITYAAANNMPILIKNGEITEGKCDKMPVGKSPKDTTPFSLFDFPVEKGNVLLAFTDGLVDQFGGKLGKKYKYTQLKNNLKEYAEMDLTPLKNNLEKSFYDWKGDLEQVDDICIIGIKI